MNSKNLLKQKIGMRLSRAGMLSKVFAIQTFAKEGFTLRPEQFTVLNALKENDGMYLRQLANITFKDRPNITRIVTILEENGYLTSTVESKHRLVKKLYITDKGKHACESLLPTILNIWEATTEKISNDEIESFLSTLDKIEENLIQKTSFQI